MTFDSLPRLRVCDACARHVFATETSCPFCAAVLAPIRARPRASLNLRLSRAQRLALASAFAGLIGCSDSHTPVTAIPVYGAPVPPGFGTGGNHSVPGTGGAVWMDFGGSGGMNGGITFDFGGAGGAPAVGSGGHGGSGGSGGGPPIDDGGRPDDDAGDDDGGHR